MIKYPIKHFGTKLMVYSKAVNTIPDHFLSYSRNARIYDGGICARKWMSKMIVSPIAKKNRGGFVVKWILYEVLNGKIYEIDLIDWVQIYTVDLWYDLPIDYLVYSDDFVIISAVWQALIKFNGTTCTTITTAPTPDSNFLEYCRSFNFLANKNILYISRMIVEWIPDNAYDFTGIWTQTVHGKTVDNPSSSLAFDNAITAMKATMHWLYIFTSDQVHYIDANSLQNVAGAATFISHPLWDTTDPMNDKCIVSSWDTIFYLTKTLNIQTVQYQQYTVDSILWELSSVPIIGIKELLRHVDPVQPSAFWFYNEYEKSINFFVRSVWSPFNNYVIVYDLVNKTWNLDTGRNFSSVIRIDRKYYWFSDVNSCIYEIDNGNTDNWIVIDFRIETQNMNQWSENQKLYWWLYILWWINPLSKVKVFANIDNEQVFYDEIGTATVNVWNITWEIWWESLGEEMLWWNTNELWKDLVFFDLKADEWRIYQYGQKIQLVFTCNSIVQDFLIDTAWIFFLPTWFTDTQNKF